MAITGKTVQWLSTKTWIVQACQSTQAPNFALAELHQARLNHSDFTPNKPHSRTLTWIVSHLSRRTHLTSLLSSLFSPSDLFSPLSLVPWSETTFFLWTMHSPGVISGPSIPSPLLAVDNLNMSPMDDHGISLASLHDIKVWHFEGSYHFIWSCMDLKMLAKLLCVAIWEMWPLVGDHLVCF